MFARIDQQEHGWCFIEDPPLHVVLQMLKPLHLTIPSRCYGQVQLLSVADRESATPHKARQGLSGHGLAHRPTGFAQAQYRLYFTTLHNVRPTRLSSFSSFCFHHANTACMLHLNILNHNSSSSGRPLLAYSWNPEVQDSSDVVSDST